MGWRHWISCFFLLLSFSCTQQELGVMYNESGEQAPIDIPSLKGAKLAMKNHKPFTILVKDTQSDLGSVSHIAREIAPAVFALMGYSDTDMVRAAAGEVPEKLFLTSGATSPTLPIDYPNVYLVCFSDREQAAAAAQFALNQLGLKTVCILSEDSLEYTIGLSKYFRENFKGTILSEEHFSQTLSLETQLTKIKALKPDFIYVAAGPAEAPKVIEKIRGFNLSQPIVGGDSFDSSSITHNPQMDQIYFTTHAFLDPNTTNPTIRKFLKRFKETYHQEEPNAFAALGYDAVNLMAAVIKRSGAYDTDSLREALNSTRNFPGVTGDISFLNGSHIPRKPVTIVQVLNGKASQAAQFIP